MARFLYNLILVLGAVLALPLVLALWLVSEKRRKSLPSRLGFQDLSALDRLDERPVWVHALSVGEMNAAAPLVRALAARPGPPVVVSASTRTGMRRARELFPGTVAAVFYFPLDLPLVASRMVRRVAPARFVLVETDLWPNFLAALSRQGVPAVLVNGRLSDKSFAGYCRARFLMGPLFAGFAGVGAATQAEAQRFTALGAGPVRVTGNLKFDAARPPESGPPPGLEGRPLVVAGSTHAGEEEVLARILPDLKRRFSAALVVAPRDPVRARKVVRVFTDQGLLAEVLSRAGETPGLDVVVVDRMGVLAGLYGTGRACFVGGSLVAEGGHNPLEPAAAGRPVVFGPHMEDFREIANTLEDRGAALRVRDGEALAEALAGFLAHPEKADAMGENGLGFVEENRGAVSRTLALLDEVAK
ncbi:MAG: 3-deoxy-D-manno-octulosonic acid transferase [Proteobacteria bacterium]|nr:3-deoxy-D-manno-octulosonic acid transferase [Pseudomonadota bacterium]